MVAIQGHQCKTKKFRFTGQFLDAWVGNSVNDTQSVTLSANGTAKQYTIKSVTPITQGLKSYHVLIINVYGYITLASGSTSGSATITVTINGTTATSVTISNTANQQIIAFQTAENTNGWTVGNIPTPANNNIQITVTLGTGTASVTISQVQILDIIQINGGSGGTTVSLSYSGTFDYENEDPSIIIAPLSKIALGYWQYISGINGTVTYTITGSNQGSTEYNSTGASSFTMPATVTNNNASGTITISVLANASIQLLNWFVFISYFARNGVVFPNGETVFGGAIGFVKGVVYLQQAYFMINIPSNPSYTTELETSHYANMFKVVNNGSPSAFLQGLINYPQSYQAPINTPSAPLTPNNTYCCNLIIVWAGGLNQASLNFFTAIFNADNSVFHQPWEDLSILLIIEAEVVV